MMILSLMCNLLASMSWQNMKLEEIKKESRWPISLGFYTKYNTSLMKFKMLSLSTGDGSDDVTQVNRLRM